MKSAVISRRTNENLFKRTVAVGEGLVQEAVHPFPAQTIAHNPSRKGAMHDVGHPRLVLSDGFESMKMLPEREGTGHLAIREVVRRLDLSNFGSPTNRDVEHRTDTVCEDLACVNRSILPVDVLKMHVSRSDFRQIARLRKEIPGLLLADGQYLMGFETTNDHIR